MMRPLVLAASTLFLAMVGVVYASSPAGLYVLVEEVRLEPQGREPTSISIRGVFMNEPSSDDTTSFGSYGPVRGWVKFELPNNKEKQALARLEWMDFTNAKNKVVAFGSAYTPILSPAIGHVVKAELKNVNPIRYPVDHGMYLIRDKSDPAKALYTFRDKNPAAK
jgi:hypothetical protein